ncbi:MAG TPA: Imm8 family immunity protein [Rhizobium sp.]|nr:Imm8 family immunity protein [Rhizobium sp.]
MAQANEEWHEIAKVTLPERLSLRSIAASNLGNVAESRIRDGYTQEEIEAGANMLDSVERLQQWEPVNPRSVALTMCLEIGWDDDAGADDFNVYVVTNDLRSHFPRRSNAWLFVDVLDWRDVLSSVLNILRKCERSTWEESIVELRKRFDWEYE